MQISDKGIDFIEKAEGVRTSAYQDSSGTWTIGVGHTKDVKEGQSATAEQIDRWLREDLKAAETAISSYVKVPLTQNQFDALCSLVFNIGPGNFKSSTVLRMLNLGGYAQAAEAFLMWDRAAGRVVDGLSNRRLAEKLMFTEV